jgi:hypothetical protein
MMESAAVAPLSDLPDTATVREAAARMTYEEACRVAESILDDVRVGKIKKPYTEAQRLSLRACAEVFKREATP